MKKSGKVDPSPNLAAQVSLALQHHRAGDFVGAEALYRQILESNPGHADTLHLYGCLAGDQGQYERSIALITQAIERSPTAYPYYYNLANQLAKAGRLDEAARYFRTAIQLKPDYAFAYNNLGQALFRQGDNKAAIDCYRTAIKLQANYADAHYNLGLALQDMGDLGAAQAAYLEAIRIRPAYELAHYNLGNLYAQVQNPDAAIAAYRQALSIRPTNNKAHTNLGNVLLKLGQPETALICFREGLRLDPQDVFSHSNVLLAMNYAAGYSAHDIFCEHLEFGQNHAHKLRRIGTDINHTDIDRKLRVGYVSGDFRWHAVAYFVDAVLQHHDHQAFELFGYSNTATEDAVTQRLKGHFDHWRNIRALDDDHAAELIARDKIDILVDLSGHTADNRLLVFARKPAPIQVTWLGYPNTTGLQAMDYRLTDGYAEPEGMTEQYNVEKLWRLPDVFCCYTPCADKPERRSSPELNVQPTPALKNGYVTFGCFNNLAKMSPPVVALWARLLREVPRARLMLEAAGLDTDAQRKHVREQFAVHGIHTDRLVLLGRTPEQQYVLYHEVDIALDPFPCNGGTTSFDTLWMGVPLVTLAGHTFVSRMGVSLLSTLGLTELIAQTEDQYIAIAKGLVSNLDSLNELRLDLRPRMETSALLDQTRFTKNMEAALRGMWAVECAAKNLL
ncbi:MAG: tetratricopeptide repeat protein [Rhodoferax sp.]